MKLNEERVLLLMEEKEITQRKMAKDLSISPTTLNGYLHAKYQHVDDSVIRDIADYLGVSVNFITDKSDVMQIGNGVQTVEEAALLDDFRQLSPENQKLASVFTKQLLNSRS